MQAYLKIKHDYAISPDDRAFMVHGTKGHANLEAEQDEYSFLEEHLGADITGIADVLEIENGRSILVDYKTSGSYKVAKALGFYVDEEPTGEVYKSGPRKGQEKTRKILKRSNDKIDRRDWELQLNKYRLEFEKAGMSVDEMRIQCVVRDGGTYIARSRGIFRKIYYFKINYIDDNYISNYFKEKKQCLEAAIKTGWSRSCDRMENWDGLKCQSYCEVAEFCSYGKYLKQEKQKEDDVINGISQVRRLPRLGKIRLGIKKVSAKGVEYPAEIDYFRIDPKTPSETENKKLTDEFHRLYGDQPKSIKIMFPLPDPGIVFPQWYKRYAYGVLKCKGDGIEATAISDQDAEGLEIIGQSETGGVKVKCAGQDCPYYQGKKCGEHAALSILLPDLPGAGVWEINTGSFHSIVNINSCLDYVRAMCGRFHMIPLILERRMQEIQYEGKKSKHYILHINMDFKLSDLQRLAQVDPEKMLLQVPDIEPDKEDILLLENKNINPETGEITEEEHTVPPVTPSPKPENPAPALLSTEAQQRAIHTIAKQKGVDLKTVYPSYGVTSTKGLTKEQAGEIISTLNNMKVNKSDLPE